MKIIVHRKLPHIPDADDLNPKTTTHKKESRRELNVSEKLQGSWEPPYLGKKENKGYWKTGQLMLL